MSPATLNSQVNHLAAELAKCIRMCEDIRVNRHIGSTHENLDKLQSALEMAETAIPASYNSIREYVGIELDIGDDRARSEMDRHIHEVQTKIRPRLRNIAHPQPGSDKGRNPGFRDLRQQWQTINDGVTQTIHSLSRRIDAGSGSDTTSIPAPASKTKKVDIRIPSKELIDHFKNSWEEAILGGKLVYVNMYERSKRQYERPEGAFIKTLLGRPSRAPSWDRQSPRIGGNGW